MKLDLHTRRWPPAPNAGDRMEVMNALISRDWTDGKFTAEVEQRMCQITGAPHAVAFNSCTSAIHATLAAQNTHIVEAPAFTFAGTITGAGHLDRGLALIDVHPDTLNLDPESMDDRGSERVTVIAVDLHGVPHTLDRNAVITDACQSLGTLLDGAHIGATGTHCWSFSSAKLIAAPDGGAVTTDNPETATLLRTLRDYGMPPGGARSEKTVARRDGHNWRPSELSMALVASRLDWLFQGFGTEPGLAERANRVGTALHEATDAAGLWRQQAPPNATVAWHKIRIGPPDATRSPVAQVQRARMQDVLHAAGIPTHRWGSTPLHQHPAYLTGWHLPVAELAALNTFCLGTEACPPLTWTDSEIAYVQGVIDELGKVTA